MKKLLLVLPLLFLPTLSWAADKCPSKVVELGEITPLGATRSSFFEKKREAIEHKFHPVKVWTVNSEIETEFGRLVKHTIFFRFSTGKEAVKVLNSIPQSTTFPRTKWRFKSH